jgi:hypothetical protein
MYTVRIAILRSFISDQHISPLKYTPFQLSRQSETFSCFLTNVNTKKKTVKEFRQYGIPPEIFTSVLPIFRWNLINYAELLGIPKR